MRKNVLFYLILSVIYFNCCVSAQNINSEQQIIDMLTNFYTAYNSVWINTPVSTPANVLHEKLDSLQEKYCSVKLRDKAKRYFEYGQDLLTNDLGSVYANEDLKVEKDSVKENSYIVSFVASNSDVSGKLIKQKVVLHVSVIKVGEGYKIDEVQ